jgi:pyruvate,water dikinase
MTPKEVSSIFSIKIYKNDIQNRINGCCYIWKNDKSYVITDKNIDRTKKIMFEDKNQRNIKEFTGLCASPGKVIGVVKVCKSSTEVGKVQKGDILVAIMTRPDYIIGMKKASAIVTNEGGITCHAAIVSRELGIPCIIGTKIATEILADGDQIEVDANNGVIKILSKKD